MAQNRKLTEIDTIPFQGGMDTYHDPAVLPSGSYSLIQNIRQKHPGFKQRPGYIKAHTTADSTNSVVSMFQFKKGSVDETHFYAQMSDGDVLEASVNPPTSEELMTLDVAPSTTWSEGDTITGVTSGKTCVIVCNVSSTSYYIKDRSGTFTSGEVLTNGTVTADQGDGYPSFSSGVFGTEVFSGTASSKPATWTILNDLLIYSNGVDQHQICAGTTAKIKGFVVYNHTEKLPDYPTDHGIDYTDEINSSVNQNNAILDSLGTTYTTVGDDDEVTVSSSGSTLTGIGTEFLSQLTVGQPIVIEGYAASTIIGTNVPSDGDQLVIDTKTYTWKTALTPTEGEVLIGGSLAVALDNLKLAINRTDPDAHDGINYKIAAAHSTVGATTNSDTTQKILALNSGTSGNSIATTIPGGGSGNYSFTGLTLSGGVNSESNIIDSITDNTTATTKTALSGTHTASTLSINHDCIIIQAEVMPNRINWTLPYPNGNSSVLSLSYWTATGWKNLTVTDGSALSGKTLGQNGSTTWTQTTDHIEKFLFGRNAFSVKVAFTAALDSQVEVSGCTYGSGFTSLQDVWDGDLVDAIEAQVYSVATSTAKKYAPLNVGTVSSQTTGSVGLLATPAKKENKNPYSVYGTTSIDISALTPSDVVFFSTADPIVGFYIDVGSTPNTTASTRINSVGYSTSEDSGVEISNFTDGSNGIAQSGFVSFMRQPGIKPFAFNSTGYQAYWYYFTVDKTLSDDISISIQVIPYYDINNYGAGLCGCGWKGKMAYAFDKDPSYLYIVNPSNIQSISSTNTYVWEVGDGRNNKIVNMKHFYNELVVFQEEKGSLGGCVTLMQGSDVEDMGKINISNYYGTMNANSVEVIEPSLGGHNIYFLSKKGIMVSTGKEIQFAENFDMVKNYFDPTDSDCIRNGYEHNMYLNYDSAFNIIKIGLTTGSATQNNVFLVYDLTTRTFMCDTYANNFSCEYECDALYGNAPIVRLAGGQANGFIYILNNGLNDITTAINAQTTLELNKNGKVIRDCSMIIRSKTQSSGSIIITPYYNGVIQSSLAKTRLLTAEKTGERIRRHRMPLNFKDQNVSINISHNTLSESMCLLDYGVDLEEYITQ
jgi:hypothetical protein